MIWFVRFLISIPIVILGETLRNLGMWIAPVRVISRGGIYQSELGGIYVNGFGTPCRTVDDLGEAQTFVHHRVNRDCEHYRLTVEEQERVRAAKRDEAKPLCP